MAEMMTPVFLATAAHATMIFCSFFNKDDHVYASLPPVPELQSEVEDLNASITTCLGLSLVLALVEMLLLFRQITPPTLAIFTLLAHDVACIVLLKFTLDKHPVSHFWILFSAVSVPTATGQLLLFANSFNKRQFC